MWSDEWTIAIRERRSNPTPGSAEAPWNVTSSAPPGPYPRDPKHVEAITTFIDQALAEPEWRGNGLEFDRL
jgi:hypothetical protein